MKQLIVIGNLIFSSKKEALLYYKTILNSYKKGQKLEEKDFFDVCELLKIHPKSTERIGCGINLLSPRWGRSDYCYWGFAPNGMLDVSIHRALPYAIAQWAFSPTVCRSQ